MAALKRPPKILPSSYVLFDIFSPQTPDILSRLGVCNNRDKLSYRDDELVSF
jgi:hypothetical protein